LAEPLSRLSLEEALQFAFNNNPEFKAKAFNLDIREAQIKTARARPNPTILTDSGTAEDTYRAGISYNFELGGKRQKKTAVSKAVFKAEAERFKTERINFRNNVRQAYAQLYYARKQLDALKQINANTEELLSIANKREKTGDISVFEVSQVELTKLNTENQYDKAEYQVQEAHHQLEFLLNMELADNIELTALNHLPKLPEALSSENLEKELIELALTNRPELKTSEFNQESVIHELKLAKTKRIPDLLLSAGPDFVTGNNSGTGIFFIAQMSLPIFNRNHGEIEAAEAKKDQLILEHEGVINSLKTQVEHAYLAYLFQHKIVNRYEDEILLKAKEILDKSYRSFELGKSPVLVSLKAQSDYISTQLNYIQSLIDYQKSISMLEKAIGAEL
jgi:cobalt-zinc-cadmium efflux system outer membrane protein